MHNAYYFFTKESKQLVGTAAPASLNPPAYPHCPAPVVELSSNLWLPLGLSQSSIPPAFSFLCNRGLHSQTESSISSPAMNQLGKVAPSSLCIFTEHLVYIGPNMFNLSKPLSSQLDECDDTKELSTHKNCTLSHSTRFPIAFSLIIVHPFLGFVDWHHWPLWGCHC